MPKTKLMDKGCRKGHTGFDIALYKTCPICRKITDQNWRKLNSDKIRLINRKSGAKYRLTNRDKVLRKGITYQKQFAIDHPDIIELRSVKHDYSLSTEEAMMWIAQRNVGKCAILGCLNKPRYYKHHIDHDHKTGRVRGILCSDHNARYVSVLENPEECIKVIKYLGLSEVYSNLVAQQQNNNQ